MASLEAYNNAQNVGPPGYKQNDYDTKSDQNDLSRDSGAFDVIENQMYQPQQL